MDFTPPKGKKFSLLLPRRSVFRMEGDVRYDWKHGIPYRVRDKLEDGRISIRSKRISLTFRIIIDDFGNYMGQKPGVYEEPQQKNK